MTSQLTSRLKLYHLETKLATDGPRKLSEWKTYKRRNKDGPKGIGPATNQSQCDKKKGKEVVVSTGSGDSIS